MNRGIEKRIVLRSWKAMLTNATVLNNWHNTEECNSMDGISQTRARLPARHKEYTLYDEVWHNFSVMIVSILGFLHHMVSIPTS